MSKLLRYPLSLVAPDIFPPRATWSESQIPDLSGKVALVTGGTSGIGQRMCTVLLSKGAKVYVAARSKEKADKAMEEIKKESGKTDVHFIQCELGDIESCKQAAKDFLAKEDELDILCNNGGVMHCPAGSKSASGHEMQFATNVVGPYVLTQELLPALKKAAHSKAESRVVWIASQASMAAPSEGINFDVLHDGTDPAGDKTLSGSWQYGQSKLANILLARESAKRNGKDGVLHLSVHPGIIRSPLWRHSESLAAKFMNVAVFIDVPEGTLTQLYAATSPDFTVAKDNGTYLSAICRRVKPPHKKATNDELAAKLWSWLEKETGVTDNPAATGQEGGKTGNGSA